ncbi:DUF3055 domain-containing protein [Gorillibacterium sp. sgz5001074]|uniref:DUF3055 domain-containing protein n=1 Tax=Gorillibacterium sp. sgz5001074 TaxID=3446695 RepID=UPI003F663750
MFDRLYDVSERSQVNFIGYVSETARYDFAIVYTDSFFGKPLVICMQTGKSALLCEHDLENKEYLQHVFNISGPTETEELSLFLRQRLPAVTSHEQY